MTSTYSFFIYSNSGILLFRFSKIDLLCTENKVRIYFELFLDLIDFSLAHFEFLAHVLGRGSVFQLLQLEY